MPSRFSDEAYPTDVGLLTCPMVAHAKPDKWLASSTAVLIAPGLALTAKNVIEDYYVELTGVRPTFGDMGEFGLGVFQPLLSGVMVGWARRLHAAPPPPPDRRTRRREPTTTASG